MTDHKVKDYSEYLLNRRELLAIVSYSCKNPHHVCGVFFNTNCMEDLYYRGVIRRSEENDDGSFEYLYKGNVIKNIFPVLKDTLNEKGYKHTHSRFS